MHIFEETNEMEALFSTSGLMFIHQTKLNGFITSITIQ